MLFFLYFYNETKYEKFIFINIFFVFWYFSDPKIAFLRKKIKRKACGERNHFGQYLMAKMTNLFYLNHWNKSLHKLWGILWTHFYCTWTILGKGGFGTNIPFQYVKKLNRNQVKKIIQQAALGPTSFNGISL